MILFYVQTVERGPKLVILVLTKSATRVSKIFPAVGLGGTNLQNQAETEVEEGTQPPITHMIYVSRH